MSKTTFTSERQGRRIIAGILIAAALASPSIAVSSQARAADATTPDWPCVWRKTLQLDAATIWDGPSVDGSKSWQGNDDIRKLSQFLISRRVTLEEVDAAVKKFAEAQPADVRDQKLTDLFAAVLSRSNDDRKLIVSGIERFHKRQLARAKEIEKQGIVLPKAGETMPTEPISATEIDKLTDEEERYKWDVRVFQERQQNIPVACEIPQLMDERTGAVARAIRAEMKS